MKYLALCLYCLPSLLFAEAADLRVKFDNREVSLTYSSKAELRQWVDWMYWPRMEDARDEFDEAFVKHYKQVKWRVGIRRTKQLIYRSLLQVLEENPELKSIQQLTSAWYQLANTYSHWENWAIRLGPHYVFLGRRCYLTPECPAI